MQAKSIMALFETTKEQRMSLAMNLIADLENGNANPLKVHSQFKSMEQLIEMMTDSKKFPVTAARYKAMLMDEAAKYGSKSFEMHNATFTIKNAGGKMDYTVCQDPAIIRMMAEAAALDAKIKERQKILCSCPKNGMPMLDEETGELNHVYPPVNNTSSETISVTLK